MDFGVHSSFHQMNTRCCIHPKLLILYPLDGLAKKTRTQEIGMSEPRGM